MKGKGLSGEDKAPVGAASSLIDFSFTLIKALILSSGSLTWPLLLPIVQMKQGSEYFDVQYEEVSW